MEDQNRKRGAPRRYAAFLLSLALLLLCAGCGGGVVGREEEIPGSETEQGAQSDGAAGSQEAGESSTPDISGNGAGDTNPGGYIPNPPPINNGIGGPPGPPPEFENMVDMYNVVFVLDTSGSMNVSDPDRRAMYSTCMFLDTLFISDEGGDQKDGIPSARVGLVWYNDGEPHTAFDDLARLDDVEAVDVIKQQIYSIYRGPDRFGRLKPALSLRLAFLN